jgi:hypothetical protein
MGLYNGNLSAYYHTPSLEELGSYQFVSMSDIINNFRVGYVGEDKIIPKVSRVDIRFHAMRGLQELTYDTFRSCKGLELEVPPHLLLPLPHDYVEYTKISWKDSNGNCHTVHQCKKCPKDALAYRQDENGNIHIGEVDDGPIKEPIRKLITEGYCEDTNEIDEKLSTWEYGEGKDSRTKIYSHKVMVQKCYDPVYADIIPPGRSTDSDTKDGKGAGPFVKDSAAWANASASSSNNSSDSEDKTLLGARYGLDTQHANANGCFWINCRTGQIHFGSNLAGKTVIIEYMSDSLGTDDEMKVHKFAEEAMYKHIAHAILNTRANTDRNIVATFKKERFAAIRNAKLRLSSIKLEELTQTMRGKSKWIKH